MVLTDAAQIANLLAGMPAGLAALTLGLPLLGFLGRTGISGNGGRPPRPEARVTELEHELERLRTVIRQTASLNATLSYDRVLERILDVSASAIINGNPEDRQLISVLLLVSGDSLEVALARGLTTADQRVRLRGENGAIERALTAAIWSPSTILGRTPSCSGSPPCISAGRGCACPWWSGSRSMACFCLSIRTRPSSPPIESNCWSPSLNRPWSRSER
jgi:hypothetical protein